MLSCFKSETGDNHDNPTVVDTMKETEPYISNTVQGILEDSVTLEETERHVYLPKSPLFTCVSKLSDNLLLSSATAADAANLEYFRVTCVINSAAELPDTPVHSSSVKYFKIPIFDNATTDILSHLDYTSDKIHQEITNGGTVLVHCVAGISRSATICIAYFMKYHRMSLLNAYNHVKLKRPIIKPNCGFFRQLIAYEKALFGTNTVKMVFNETVKMEIPDVYDSEYKNIMTFRRKRRDMVRRH